MPWENTFVLQGKTESDSQLHLSARDWDRLFYRFDRLLSDSKKKDQDSRFKKNTTDNTTPQHDVQHDAPNKKQRERHFQHSQRSQNFYKTKDIMSLALRTI